MPARALPLVALLAAIAALSATAEEPKKPAEEKKEVKKEAPDGPAVQKLKQAEEAYKAAREEAYKEVADGEKKARAAFEKSQKDLLKAGADKDARAKAREEMAKAQDELERLSKARVRIMSPSFGPVVASLPAPKEETRFGARFARPSELVAAHLDLEKNRGLVIERVEKDQVADKAGLKTNDVLVEVGGKPVPSDIEEFRKLLAEVKPDQPVALVVFRQGKKETIKDVKLPAAPQPRRP